MNKNSNGCLRNRKESLKALLLLQGDKQEWKWNGVVWCKRKRTRNEATVPELPHTGATTTTTTTTTTTITGVSL
ncbi:hypothetical protein M0804_003990 [Polistes exclamans]|nr:hypothetical protein M0804_003990 [Polistes exclamans]